VRALSLSGGEPLLREGLPDLLDAIRKDGTFNRDSKIVVISNGKAMSEDWLKRFKKYDIHLTLSLPGIAAFEELTGTDNAGGVLHWLSRAHEEGLTTTCNIPVTKKNLHELYETIANALVAGADMVLVNRFLVGGRGFANRAELELSKEEINEMLDTAEEVLGKGKRRGYTGTEIPRCVITKGVEHYKNIGIGTLCGAAKTFLAVDPAGNLRVCNHSPFVVGHVFDKDFITDGAYWDRFLKSDYKPDFCRGCKDIERCDCGCREACHIVAGDLGACDNLLPLR